MPMLSRSLRSSQSPTHHYAPQGRGAGCRGACRRACWHVAIAGEAEGGLLGAAVHGGRLGTADITVLQHGWLAETRAHWLRRRAWVAYTSQRTSMAGLQRRLEMSWTFTVLVAHVGGEGGHRLKDQIIKIQRGFLHIFTSLAHVGIGSSRVDELLHTVIESLD